MIPQFDNILMTSMLLWLDNKIVTNGQAYTNYQSVFYPLSNMIYGYYTYGAPLKQMVIDSSISGANIISGVYVNGVFTVPGENNLSGINATEGQLYFSQPISNPSKVLSGNYAIKDYNIYLTSKTEENLLFETQYQINPKTYQNPTGLPIGSETYPVIYLKYQGGKNKPLAFGGFDQTVGNVRAVILSDSVFSLDAVTSIMRDTSRELIPLIYPNEMPFNSLGSVSVSGNNFNYIKYTANKANTDDYLYINEVNVTKTDTRLLNATNSLNRNVYSAFVDFEVVKNRYPRQ
jgi:hypothetical protein